MIIIKILSEFMHSPIWTYDNDEIVCDTPHIIENSKQVQEIANQMETMFGSYYEFDSHSEPCWFNYEKEKQDKPQMLSLARQLTEEINKINDGSFIVIDEETSRLLAL